MPLTNAEVLARMRKIAKDPDALEYRLFASDLAEKDLVTIGRLIEAVVISKDSGLAAEARKALEY